MYAFIFYTILTKLICKAGKNINNLVLTLSVIIVLVTWDIDSQQTAPLKIYIYL
jgi:hypothetical protein